MGEKIYKNILTYLLQKYPYEIIDLYDREEDVRNLEPILTDIGISSQILDKYMSN